MEGQKVKINHQTFVVGYIRVGSVRLKNFVPKDRLFSVKVEIFHGFSSLFGTLLSKKPLNVAVLGCIRTNLYNITVDRGNLFSK